MGLALSLLIFGSYALLQVLNSRPAAVQHLGAEYYNIARALADGRGFSDPFGERTGPTAWMPPLYPILIAGVLLLVKTRSAAAAIIAALSNLSLAFIGACIYGIARRSSRRLPPIIAVIFYLLWLIAFNYWLLTLTHDIWLNALGVNLTMLAVYRFIASGRMSPVPWGALGGGLALTSPTLMVSWCSVSIWLFTRTAKHRRGAVLAACLALAVAAPWAVRNALIFHQFVPVKSNLYFDAYQANYVDDDGLYDDLTLGRHPFGAPNLRFLYAKLGEAQYTSEYRKRFASAFAHRPRRFFIGVAHRALAALAWSVPLGSEHQTSGELLLRQILYPLPLIGGLVGMVLKVPHRRLSSALAVCSAAYLLPYVLVAFYVRFLLPLTPILSIQVFLGCDALAFRWRRSASSEYRSDEASV